jgi:hypothetical protein
MKEDIVTLNWVKFPHQLRVRPLVERAHGQIFISLSVPSSILEVVNLF